jgi:GT2 family glycosyltransferase
MTSSPLVFVVVLNYNGLKYLQKCISSLEGQTYSNYKILVFDNASTDHSQKLVKKNYPNVILIENKQNVGFAEGNNLAIKFALNQKADYVFLVNNDTESENDLIDKLVNTAKLDNSIGIVAPVVHDLTKKFIIQEIGMASDRFGFPLAIRQKSGNGAVPFFVSGCAMMIKSELLRNIGFFDEKYFMFAEDLDYCWRARLAGYKVVVDKTARIYHASGASMKGGVIKASIYRTSSKRVFLRERNTIRTLIKDYNTANLFLIVPFYVSLLFVEASFWLCMLRPDTLRRLLQAILWNIRFLSDTLKQRAMVQNTRKIPDSQIVKNMLKGYSKLLVFKIVGLPSFYT